MYLREKTFDAMIVSPVGTDDLFLHRDCVPIETVDFDKKIAEKEHLLHRDEECSGMCGV